MSKTHPASYNKAVCNDEVQSCLAGRRNRYALIRDKGGSTGKQVDCKRIAATLMRYATPNQTILQRFGGSGRPDCQLDYTCSVLLGGRGGATPAALWFPALLRRPSAAMAGAMSATPGTEGSVEAAADMSTGAADIAFVGVSPAAVTSAAACVLQLLSDSDPEINHSSGFEIVSSLRSQSR